ncbi:hypothetical protein BU17DRAFT_71368 [Hysterangium stoloniferum]|nr:hypothetical protein BU17DRAFT_71368 [Hysterangium stoloniferum]
MAETLWVILDNGRTLIWISNPPQWLEVMSGVPVCVGTHQELYLADQRYLIVPSEIITHIIPGPYPESRLDGEMATQDDIPPAVPTAPTTVYDIDNVPHIGVLQEHLELTWNIHHANQAELAMPVAPPPTPAPTPPTPATTMGVVDDDDVSDVEEIHGNTSSHPDMWDERQPIISFTVGEAQGGWSYSFCDSAGDLQESGRRYTSADLKQSSNWTQT